MTQEVIYPTPEKIIEYNALAIMLLKVKKADKSVVLSRTKLIDIIEVCKKTRGDIYDKATILLKGLIQQHPFASGNGRTAFITTKDFVTTNKTEFGIRDDPLQAKVMTGIREGFYTDDDIKKWIQYGKIKAFIR